MRQPPPVRRGDVGVVEDLRRVELLPRRPPPWLHASHARSDCMLKPDSLTLAAWLCRGSGTWTAITSAASATSRATP